MDKSLKRKSHSYKAEAGFSVFGSLAQGVDLMEGILEECEKHGIRSGKVTCIGSLKKVGYVLFETGEDGMPTGYGKEMEIPRIVEMIQCTGFICEDENGELDLHLHGIVIEESGKISAGHFLRGKNPTLITVEFQIASAGEVRATRTYDEDLGFKVINFSK
ncbi:PPC domain-containing DNA-binding protein [Virgibacillus alimentarius]|uniref:PPC domain-containing DNA-binding protein n=1 Tax=Virgibacillus alimentarius TaxID=698769 RepID=UPI00068EF6BD|nr:PPC domain-containing DNA-binding protein [Virgibacillus alimentarius]